MFSVLNVTKNKYPHRFFTRSLCFGKSYNPGQNIWSKKYLVKKYSKIRQNFQNIVPNFVFFDIYCQCLISGRKTGQ